MTTEQKAKAYDKVREKIALRFGSNVAEEIFSEFEMSEDERIRKELIEFVKSRGGFKQEYIAWLEKLKVLTEHGDGLYHFGNNGFTYIGNPTWDNVSFLEGEQKPFDYENATIVQKDFSPKEEPKFKVGDWVVWDNKISCHIDNIYQGKESLMYTITDDHNMTRSYSVKSFDNNARHWTIQDAKDGDVLVSKNNKPFIYNGNWDSFYIGSYCGISVGDNFTVATEKCYWTKSVNIHPATKEQRDLLFQKMHEAGYTFDFEKKELKKLKFRVGDEIITKNEESLTITRIDEKGYWSNDLFICSFDDSDEWELVEKKELKKIENRPMLSDFFNAEYERGKADALQSIEWNEEDEKNLAQCIEAIDACYKWDSMIDWLKSLRSRSRWKPSEEQMKALDSVIDEYDGYPEFDSLVSLKNDLKKL